MYVISHMWILLNPWQTGLYSSKALLQLQNYQGVIQWELGL